MRKSLLVIIAILLYSFTLIADNYQVGDQIENFSWMESDGGVPVSRTLGEITENKMLLIVWGTVNDPYMEDVSKWLDWINTNPDYSDKIHFVFASIDDDDFTSLNGNGWRTRYEYYDLSYNVSTMSELGSFKDLFGVTEYPFTAIIGVNNFYFRKYYGPNDQSDKMGGFYTRNNNLRYCYEDRIRASLDTLYPAYSGEIVEANPIQSMKINLGESTSCNLHSLFLSANQFTISIDNISAPEAISAEISDDTLNISAAQAYSVDEATITLIATSSNSSKSSEVEVKIENPSAPWLEWGNQYPQNPSWVFGPSSTYHAACDFDIGSNSSMIEKFQVRLYNTQSNVAWKIVRTEGNNAPGDDIIGTLSGSFNSVEETMVTIPVSDNSIVTGKFAFVLDVTDWNNMALDKTGNPDHTWVNAGDSWMLLKEAMPDPYSWGAWFIRVKMAGYTGIEDQIILPGSTTLSQNYPNPFNPTTRIDFFNNMSGKVELNVYNSNGEIVSTIINGMLTAGNHSVNFDASELNNGVYFYTLKTPTKTLTKKMVLVK
ncbi:MAG: T9SS type A sorting domain-containing protein [Candidatus Delongbacteria bacterium]|nr:T9SS type A sorting domain-containing protein [Candidatus Delongbacteria bacterium]MBN2834808.1 T9SS type A sorting domain-containing protein [Candidatus Delongbacteria bacterium]